MDPKNGEDQLDVQVLLDFLRLMYSSKATEAKEIRGHLQMLDDDIQQVRQNPYSEITFLFSKCGTLVLVLNPLVSKYTSKTIRIFV